MKKLLLIIAVLLSAIAVAQSLDTGKELYEKAMAYETGNDSVAADSVKSRVLYRLAAEAGYIPAQNYLGFLYYNSKGAGHNVDSALYWIEKAALQGDVKAAGNLGFLYSAASDIQHDYSLAFKWLEKAADAGLPTSFTQLGDLYRQGQGVTADTLKAVELYERANRARIPDAEYRLLSMMGYEWKKLTPDSAVNLGLKYYNNGAPVIGVDLFENAASQGNSKAMALLGDAYSRAYGVGYDHEKSLEYFLQSAVAGNPSAQFVVAETLEIFPDLISEELISKLYPDGLQYPFSFDNISSPQFWYDKASLGGVADADTAYSRLFSE